MRYFLPEKKMKVLFKYFFVRDFLNSLMPRKDFEIHFGEFDSSLKNDHINEMDIVILRKELPVQEYEKAVKSLPDRQRKIANGLTDLNYSARLEAISELSEFNPEPVVPLIEQMLKDQHPLVRRRAMLALFEMKSVISIPLFENMTNDEDKDTRKWAVEYLKGLSADLRHHALYNSQEANFFSSPKKLVREEFSKTGSRIILLGGNLAGKAIIRIISQGAFEAWKKAFLAVETWKKAGFNYIPVEPILMKKDKSLYAYKAKNGDYRVYAGVLGPTLFNFMHDSNNYMNYSSQLEELRYRILLVLDHLGIVFNAPGITHNQPNNFCVQIYNEKPRLFIIDFDQARILADESVLSKIFTKNPKKAKIKVK